MYVGSTFYMIPKTLRKCGIIKISFLKQTKSDWKTPNNEFVMVIEYHLIIKSASILELPDQLQVCVAQIVLEQLDLDLLFIEYLGLLKENFRGRFPIKDGKDKVYAIIKFERFFPNYGKTKHISFSLFF